MKVLSLANGADPGMTAGSFVLMALFVVAFAGAGAVMLLIPDRLQAAGLRANYSRRNWPVLGYFWYEAIRKPSYLVGLRIMGAALLLVAALLIAIMLSAAAQSGLDL